MRSQISRIKQDHKIMRKKKNKKKKREILLEGFHSKIFLIKSEGAGFLNFVRFKFQILTPNQMLQRLPIALAQIEAGNSSERLLNEIKPIIYSQHQSK